MRNPANAIGADLRILFVEDEPMDVLGEQHALKRDGLEFASRVAVSEVELTHHLIDFMPDVVLCDYTMPGFSGPRAIDTVRRLRPSIPILMVSGSIADETAIECLNRGAADYLLKSNLRRLGPAVRRVVADTRQRQALEARIDRLEATAAMHEAKATSPGGLQFHSGDVVQHAHARRRLEIELQDAIALDGLSLCYQPQFDIRSGQVCGVEALARWVRADGDTIPPSVFISLAEQAGLIRLLGAWALREGCKTAAEWLAGGAPTPTVSINVSPRQICEEFTREIALALELSGLPGEHLELEITESVLMINTEMALRCMVQWKSLGVRIALDDFGAGYSNLAYLSKLPIDRLKIDGSLIRGISTTGSRDTTIVRAVISLAVELGITVLAECVETEEQLRILDNLGCQQAQGYLLTPPTSAAEARWLMGERWGARAPRAAGWLRRG
jgi:EAL domain-containing protein (putative c-di-GMP-specific phosphodiesterase class I)/CheY-like chemotaxis protein